MKDLIKAFNVIHSVTYNLISKYITKSEYKLRGFDSAKESAIESSFLYEVTDRRLKKTILNKTSWEYEGDLINKIINKKGLIEIVDVSKVKRIPYNQWYNKKTLCTYYENWEKLAYIVCESYSVDLDVAEVICDVIVDIAATPVECLFEANIETEKIMCETNVNISAEEIKCDSEIDIKVLAENCNIKTEIIAQEIKCENQIDISAFIELCATKYNVEINLMTCIVNDLFPSIQVLNGNCEEDVNMDQLIVEVEEDSELIE